MEATQALFLLLNLQHETDHIHPVNSRIISHRGILPAMVDDRARFIPGHTCHKTKQSFSRRLSRYRYLLAYSCPA